ncbi:MAG: patatin-like phospholipase family protein [Burkholderiales bacterium]
MSRISGTALMLLATLAVLLAPAGAAFADRPRVALVLGGGGARGIAHLGVLKALEELRIPVDCIAGTSMGALVGGAYAAGVTVDQMQRQLSKVNWDTMLVDDPPRDEKPYHAKRDDFQSLFHFELGQRGTSLQLPTGSTAGYKVEFLLRSMVAGAGNFPDQDFDRLPIPFRALVTDIADGKSRVFRRGDLAKVMRASMSVPGAISPVEIDGHLYVDGGLLQNLPVAAARQACGDVVIAVDVGSTLLKRDALVSGLAISVQMVLVLMEQNVRASVASLRPTDFLVRPELGDFSSADFAHSLSLVSTGEAAIMAQAKALQRLSVSEAEYRAWRAGVEARLPKVPPVTDVKVSTALGRVNPEVIERQLAEVPGIDLRARPETDFSLPNLHRRLEEVYGGGDFERMEYQMDDHDGVRTVDVQGVEKSWGPNYVKFGLGFSSDSYQTRFDASASHRTTWLNSLGAEWRNDARFGYNEKFSSEFYQPVSFRAGAFVAPRIEWRSDPLVYYVDGSRVGGADVQTTRLHLDGGLQNKYGEVRLGVFAGRLASQSDFGLIYSVPDNNLRQAGYTASFTFDQIDSPSLPRDGVLVRLNSFGTLKSWGSDDEYNKTELTMVGAKSFGEHAVQLAAYAGETLQGKLPIYDPFYLGGFLRGSGYRMDELLGASTALARAVYTYRFAALPPQIGRGVYFGGSLETTRAALGVDQAADSHWRQSMSLFVAADTILGTAYVALGQGLSDDHPRTLYLMLGVP